MIWRDADGHLVAFNMVHQSGHEGWMGPLAVRPDRQGEGLGSTMVRLGIDWLKGQGARTIGLETMPRTVDNIGFYSRIGLVPGRSRSPWCTTCRGAPAPPPELLSLAGRQLAAEARGVPAAHRTELVPGVDFTREIALTRDLGIGDTTLAAGRRPPAGVRPVALDPARGRPGQGRAPGAQAGGPGHRRLRAPARRGSTARPPRERVGRIAIRCQTDYAEAYLRLVACGVPGALDRPADDPGRLSAGAPAAGRRAVELGDLSTRGGLPVFRP